MQNVRTIAAAALLIGASVFSLRAARSTSARVDDLVAVRSVVDLGKVVQHRTRDAEFELVNPSARGIEIEQIYATCTCTVAKVAERYLRPGQSVTVRATFEAGESPGPKQTFLTVNYRMAGDNNYRAKHLQLRAEVEPAPPGETAPAAPRQGHVAGRGEGIGRE